MKAKIFGFEFEIEVTRAIGIAIMISGIILLVLAFNAQNKINDIGSTNDPVLEDRVLALENYRNFFMISGVGILFAGLFAAFVLVERSVPLLISESEMKSTAKISSQLISGLSLSGNALYLPTNHGLTQERIFIPAPASSSLPPVALSDDLTMSPGKDGTTPGILIEPLGFDLLGRIEKELGIDLRGTDIETAEASLQMLKQGFSAVKDFHLRETEDDITMRIEYAALAEACRNIRAELPDTCRQMSCIMCSCILTAVARATGKAVRVKSVDNSEDRIVFHLELRDW